MELAAVSRRKLVVLTGAGISAESGLATFRGAGGLWEGHRIEDVATPQAWSRNPALVLEFYNQRRKQALNAQPNRAHHIIKELEAHFDVVVITQNVDNLHEKAGSSRIIHLHGQLFQARSTRNESQVLDMEGWALNLGDLAPDGSQLRPHIVWFGEAVPMMDAAISEVESADFFLVVGTSLQVYPAASLIDFVPSQSPVYLVDPEANAIHTSRKLNSIAEVASIGMERVAEILIKAV